ncbi:LysR family transcriptional regulator, partial [Photobacterium sp. OFAV2-7]|uniref:LysR family transcriptional regulator n=1 Tax=Photobacterium sp. OFAV2-7 TaxID=2917748 RepID=UPI001EF4F9C3
MGQLEDMHVFIRVVETGSITKAAEQLNLAKSAVSKRLSELENRLNSKLINRTTRKSSLTEAGTLYYQQVKQILEEVDELNNRISSATQHLEGSLKLALPLSFGLSQLAPALDIYAKKYPNLKIETDFSDRKVDIVEEGFDLAFRIGHIEDSSFRARKIAPIKHVLCASPEYLEQHGTPASLEELKSHRFLKYGSTPQAGVNLL